MSRFAIIVGMSVLCVFSVSFAKDVPYTHDDKDRLIRFERKLEGRLKAVNHGVDALDKKIDGLHVCCDMVHYSTDSRHCGFCALG